ncbi:hypothetical protein [Sulfidibacter corallicola]|uniref:Uncharacterized protein n=1 Tax=Sulfidibacter corallicola TaxID=2818388 RepID=A0A8A4TSB6_SULCO|nr:hypothetical protein [Sulfidibacter corallicola]QTD52856.1 hypothetical protein J3U87_10295 [Sulfidibacter corallicola]
MVQEHSVMDQDQAKESVEKIFNDDEMRLMTVKPEWDEEELLGQEGIFFLKDVAQKLQVHSSEFKKEARSIEKKGLDPWDVMGIRKTWTHWQVRMKKFAPYYRAHRLPKISMVDKDWDGNTLLGQSGRFYLTDVCEKIPFSTHQIRYQVRRCENPKEEYGVWKDEQYKAYLVDMDRFSKWMKRIWLHGDFNGGREEDED